MPGRRCADLFTIFLFHFILVFYQPGRRRVFLISKTLEGFRAAGGRVEMVHFRAYFHQDIQYARMLTHGRYM